MGDICNYEDLVFFIAHTLSREEWTWFYEPEMLEGNVTLIKHMGTDEGIHDVLALFGISEPMIALIIKYYGCPDERN